MNLSLKALQTVKDNSAEALQVMQCMESLDCSNIQMELADINAQATSAIRLIDRLQDAMESLKVAGYSDVWYDTVFSSDLKAIVEIDMPKFLDNPVNRGKACMEGFLDTIKDWIVKAARILIKIIENISKFISWINQKIKEFVNNDRSFMQTIDATLKDVRNKLTEGALGISIENYYDLDAIKTMVENTSSLIGILCPQNATGESINLLSTKGTGDKSAEEIKKMFFDKLSAEIKACSRVFGTDISTGFVVQFDTATDKFVKFFGADGKDKFKTLNVDLSNIDDFRTVAQNMVSGFGMALAKTNTAITFANKALAMRKSDFEKIVSSYNYQLSPNASAEDIALKEKFANEAKAGVILSTCGLNIIGDATKFTVSTFNAYLANKKLLLAVLKAIKSEASAS